MICDELQEIINYPIIRDYYKVIMDFIEKIEVANFKPGKVMIDGSNLYAILTEYDTKHWEETPTETHDKYYDLVTLLEGSENIYVDFRNKFVICEEYSEERDVTFYKPNKEKIRVNIEPGVFVLFLPNDVHHPYCYAEEEKHIKKVTFKIKITKSPI